VTFDEALRLAMVSWPTIRAPSSFDAYLRARTPAGVQLEDWLERAPVADCYLACACGEGSPVALALFDAQVLSHIGKFLSQLRPSRDFVDEVAQVVRAKLFVAAPGNQPKINEYMGAGTLLNWVRVLSMRTAIDLKRRSRPAESSDALDESKIDPPDPRDQELAHIKDLYREQLNSALRRAFDATSTEQRDLLRMHFLEGVTFDDLATRLKIHKVTVWRKIDAARTVVLRNARDILKQELKLQTNEFDSLLRAMESHIDVSLSSFFK
jgi:RNA polymerase sigma-70 factor (ECF subfamily)